MAEAKAEVHQGQKLVNRAHSAVAAVAALVVPMLGTMPAAQVATDSRGLNISRRCKHGNIL